MSAKIASEKLASLGQFRLFLRWMLDGMTDQDHPLTSVSIRFAYAVSHLRVDCGSNEVPTTLKIHKMASTRENHYKLQKSHNLFIPSGGLIYGFTDTRL